METFPAVTPIDEADGIPDDGHLWILEAVDGGPLRFRLREDGRVDVGDDDGRFDDEVPPEYAEAVRHVRERLDRGRLRESVDDVAAVTFFGVATYRRRIDYDFERLPAVLGTEVHDGDRFLPPGAAAEVFERLGVTPVPAFEKEVRATDFDPAGYSVPTSTYADEPALGVILRSKTGDRVRIPGPAVDRSFADPITADAEAVAERFATDRRIDAVTSDLEARERPATFDAVFERVLERIYREEAHRLAVHGADVDRGALRSAVAPVVRRRLTA